MSSLSIQDEDAVNLAKNIKKVIQHVFVSAAKNAIDHFFFTWMYVEFFGVEIPFLWSSLALLCSLIPIFEPWYICIPIALFYRWISSMSFLVLIGFVGFYYFLSGKIFSINVSQTDMSTPPFFIGLSLFFGYLVFGFKGIIYGPLVLLSSVQLFWFLKKKVGKFENIGLPSLK